MEREWIGIHRLKYLLFSCILQQQTAYKEIPPLFKMSRRLDKFLMLIRNMNRQIFQFFGI